FYFRSLAARAIGDADDVVDHHRPVAVARAIARRAVGDAGARGQLVARGLVIAPLLRLRIEAQHAVGRRDPDLSLAVVVHRGRAAGGRHALGWREHLDLFRPRIQAPQAAAPGIDVEPDDAVRRARHAVALRGEPALRGNVDQLHLAGPGVQLAKGSLLVRDVAGEPDVAGVVEPGVVHAPAGNHHRRRAERPVGAVVLHEVGRQVLVGIERQVVFADLDARGFAARARIEPHFRRAVRPAGAREV